MSKDVAIVWLRNDLRELDNPALSIAYEQCENVIPLYIHDKNVGGNWKIGGASKWWLHYALSDMATKFERNSTQLYLQMGDSLNIIKKIIKDIKPTKLFYNKAFEPYWQAIENKLSEICSQNGVELIVCSGNLLFDPQNIKKPDGTYYKVYTRFWNECNKHELALSMCAKPKYRIQKAIPNLSNNLKIEELKLLPKIKWDKGLQLSWSATEESAYDLLDEFLNNKVASYPLDRNIPSLSGTSRLSPYLHFGQISVRYVMHKAIQFKIMYPNLASSINKFLNELGWREFCYYLLTHFPDLPERNFSNKFDSFSWEQNEKNLELWQKGITGFPIVDAGMRELRYTGWMHNRVRMITASFLTKDLLINWQEGEKWFWDNLVDADLANNAASWQWVAGSGADAAPYFRVFNPILQSQKFDPNGDYIRKWIPELKHLSRGSIHLPHLSGIEVNAYPKPIVDHNLARKLALSRYKNSAAKQSPI